MPDIAEKMVRDTGFELVASASNIKGWTSMPPNWTHKI